MVLHNRINSRTTKFKTTKQNLKQQNRNEHQILNSIQLFQILFRCFKFCSAVSNPVPFQILQLKNQKKSAYSDKIRNEMLKSSAKILLKGYQKLFNLLIESGKFPDQWCEGLITPIFKSGDKTIKLYIQRDLCDKLSEQVPLYCSK